MDYESILQEARRVLGEYQSYESGDVIGLGMMADELANVLEDLIALDDC